MRTALTMMGVTLGAAVSAGVASAATVTFDGIENYVTQYNEDGITVGGGQVGSYGPAGTADRGDGS